MSDYNSSLPVRSEADGTDERLHVKIVDGVASTAVHKVQVDADHNIHAEIHGNKPDASDAVVRLSELGAVNPDGVYSGTDNTKPAHVGVVGAVRAASPADADQTQRVTVKTGTTDTDVHAMDVSLHDANGNAFSSSNPLPVATAVAGTPVHDYDTSSAIAAGSPDNHDYPVAAGGTFRLSKIFAAGSGKLKVEVQTTLNGTLYSTIAVMFNSTANPNIVIDFNGIYEEIVGSATSAVRVIRTNLDKQAQDVYSTIVGLTI
jgi:hypothetical protein